MGLIIPTSPFFHLLFEALSLIQRIIELSKGIGQLPAINEKLKSIGDHGNFLVALRQWRYSYRMACNEGGLN